MKRWNIKIILPSIFILVLILGIFIDSWSETGQNKTKITESAQAENKFLGCQSRTEIQKDIHVLFCGNQIRVGWSPEVITYGDKIIEDEKSFPDLFHFSNDKSFLLLEAKSFPQNNQFFTLISTFDTGGTFRQALGIYSLEDTAINRIVRKNFSDIPGRWTKVVISENSPSFAVYGDLGQVGKLCGACRLEWMDFYTWDSSEQTFVLDNINHKSEYQELITKYEKLNPDNDELAEDTVVKINNANTAIQRILQGQSVSMFDKSYPVGNMACTGSLQCQNSKCIAFGKNPTSGTCMQEPFKGCYSELENGRIKGRVCYD